MSQEPLKISAKDVIGIVLAGGLSRRMGGVEKSFIELNQRPLIEHSLDRFLPQIKTLAINANGDVSRFAAYDYPVIKDPIDGFLGPLAGVLAGMEYAKEHHPNAPYIASIASDTPFFPKNFIERACKAINQAQSNGDKPIIALATSNGRLHPVFGLWPIALSDALHHFLTEGKTQKVLAFVDQYQLIEVPFENVQASDHEYDPFFNINTPQDLELARQIVKNTEHEDNNG